MAGIRDSLTSTFTEGTLISLIIIPAISKSHPFTHPPTPLSYIGSSCSWTGWALAALRRKSTFTGLRDFLKETTPKCHQSQVCGPLGWNQEHSRLLWKGYACTLMLHPVLKCPLRLGHRTFGKSLWTLDSLGQSWQWSAFKVFMSSLVFQISFYGAPYLGLWSVSRG